MRRDSIFYQIFQYAPTTLFELLPTDAQNIPPNADAYRFDSVAVKESQFEIDGVFLPPSDVIGPVYFCELQMQKDEQLYERVFAESLLYFYRKRERFSDWYIVIIYPTRKTEQRERHPYRTLLGGEQVYRIYLDELGDIEQYSVWVGILALTLTAQQSEAIPIAQTLLTRGRQATSPDSSRAIMEMVTTILGYQFKTLSRQEIEAMLDITFQESILYTEGCKDGQEKGEKLGLKKGEKLGLKKGEKLGLKKGEQKAIIKILTKRFGKLPDEVCSAIAALSLSQLEALSDVLLDFSNLAEVQDWLAQHPAG
jgi:predicted transposase/invertase (TIGR01784 family)